MYKRIDIMIPNMLYKWHIYIRLLFIYQEHEHIICSYKNEVKLSISERR